MPMQKKLSVTIPLMIALEQMLGHEKFINDLVTMKQTLTYEPTDNMHYCSAIICKSLVEKKSDPRAFAILFTIWSFNFSRVFCYLEASINMILFVVYKQFGQGVSKPTSLRLLLADHTVNKMFGILCDVLVKKMVATFIYLDDFMILDCQVVFEDPIMMERSLLATGRELVEMEIGKIKLRLNVEQVTFNKCQSMQ